MKIRAILEAEVPDEVAQELMREKGYIEMLSFPIRFDGGWSYDFTIPLKWEIVN